MSSSPFLDVAVQSMDPSPWRRRGGASEHHGGGWPSVPETVKTGAVGGKEKYIRSNFLCFTMLVVGK